MALHLYGRPGIRVDVREFGTISATGDNSTLLQSASDELNTKNGGTGGSIVLPQGEWIGQVALGNRVWIEGADTGLSSVLKMPNGGTGPLITNKVTGTYVAQFCGVANIRGWGNNATVSDVNSHFIEWVSGATQLAADEDFDTHQSVFNTFCTSFKGDAYHATGRGVHSWIQAHALNNDGYGFLVTHDTYASDCQVGGAGKAGWAIPFSGVNLSACKAWRSGRVDPTLGYGLYFTGTFGGLNLAGFECQHNQRSGVKLGDGTGGNGHGVTGHVVAHTNSVSSAGTYPAVDFDGAQGCILDVSASDDRDYGDSVSYQTHAYRFANGASGNMLRVTHRAANGSTVSTAATADSVDGGNTVVVGNDTRSLVAGASRRSLAKSGHYVFTDEGNSGTVGTSASQTQGTMRVHKWDCPRDLTVTKIGAEVTAVGGAGAVVRLGIYADDGNGYPGALILDAGTIDGTSATVQEITVSQALKRGTYWVGGVNQVGTIPTVRTVLFSASDGGSGTVIPTAGQTSGGWAQTAAGALPATFSASLSPVGFGIRTFVKVS